MLAAKTEFKTIASKIIQHPAVTIDRIKRRRVIDFPSKPRLGGAAVPSRSGDPAALPKLARDGHAGAVGRRLLLRVERTCRSSRSTSGFDPVSDMSIAGHRPTILLCKYSISPSPGGAP